MHYMVSDGDTLWLIAQRFRSDAEALARANSIHEPYNVYPGQILHIPRRHRLLGYVAPHAAAAGVADALSSPEPFDEIIYTSVTVAPDGSASAGPVDSAVQMVRARRTRVLASVTNLWQGAYSTQAADAALLDADTRSQLASVACDCAASNGLDGVHLEFGAITTEHFTAISELACEIREKLSRLNPWYTLSISAPSFWADEPFDLVSATKCANTVIIEGFQRGSRGPAGPPTSMEWLRRQAARAVERIDRSRLCIALGVYGLDWDESDESAFLSLEAAYETALETGARVDRDSTHGGPGFSYTDSTGRSHQVWYEDAASILMKIALLEAMGIQKIALWRLGVIPYDVLSVASQAVV